MKDFVAPVVFLRRSSCSYLQPASFQATALSEAFERFGSLQLIGLDQASR